MRRISTLVTILITSFVMTLAGLVASPIASANESGDGSISATFAAGSSVLSDAQKAEIKKAVASSGSDATFIVTGTAGKLPGVSDSKVQRLAKKRAKAIKAYLVSLGVSKTNVTTQTKMTEIGETPKISNIYSAPAPTPTVTAVAAATNSAPAAPAPTTCATGATCIVGDTGPGGGIVYYVHATTFTCGPTLAATCKYLEVAPSGWSGGGTDPMKLWALNPYANVDVTDITNHSSAYNNASGIGLGYKNSVAIVTQGNDTTTAAGAARAYAGGSKSDWYLPTTAELNLLCQWNRGVTQDVTTRCTGGNINTGTGATGSGFSGWYWSSSENSNINAFDQNFDNVDSGLQTGYFKLENDDYVRPVRAF